MMTHLRFLQIYCAGVARKYGELKREEILNRTICGLFSFL